MKTMRTVERGVKTRSTEEQKNKRFNGLTSSEAFDVEF